MKNLFDWPSTSVVQWPRLQSSSGRDTDCFLCPQDKLAKLQTLVVQLLDERHRLHSAVDAASSPALKAVANHTPQKTKSLRRSRKWQLEGTVNSDDLEGEGHIVLSLNDYVL